MTKKGDSLSKSITLKLTASELKGLRALATEQGCSDPEELLRRWVAQHIPTVAASVEEGIAVEEPILWWQEGRGRLYHGDSRRLMRSTLRKGSVDLIVTSPPFGLIRKKSYGNEPSHRYLDWFRPFAEGMKRVLKPTGSLVIDIGPAWLEGLPAKSLYQFELLTMLCEEYGFYLAQDFYWWNPARMPAPAEWVNVRRLRVKDAVNPVWWLSPTPWPKASNRRVLTPYGKSQQALFKNGYNAGPRPSGHVVSNVWGRDNGGAIPPNLIAAPNTVSDDSYQKFCREMEQDPHPARFPHALPEFFIRMLTDKGDTVLDPFAGSCVSGEVAESLGRKWICCELREDYLLGALGRFQFDGESEKAPKERGEASYVVPVIKPYAKESDTTKLDSFGYKKPPKSFKEKP
ncbi:site-specific DNA-methyltransferase [Luteibacter sp. CQ10]|uniref:site-specific DNA-methyltransferase n=1 Tax=Luteibacter sp. CQ10 TaxID=2805821 RepID=UPI0034A45A52